MPYNDLIKIKTIESITHFPRPCRRGADVEEVERGTFECAADPSALDLGPIGVLLKQFFI